MRSLISNIQAWVPFRVCPRQLIPSPSARYICGLVVGWTWMVSPFTNQQENEDCDVTPVTPP